MDTETLNCPMCGAATSTDDPLCRYCEARLATVACASCFGMIFVGSKHCPRCGAAVALRAYRDLPGGRCPRCRIEMRPVSIGETNVQECERCSGLWVDVPSFEEIYADREEQAAVLGAASPARVNDVNKIEKVRYSPCPVCKQLMNRMNFDRSGVILDICKGHGVWFDRDELTRIVEFIRAGNLGPPRNKHKAELEEERRRTYRFMTTIDGPRPIDDDYSYRSVAIASAGDLLDLLRD